MVEEKTLRSLEYFFKPRSQSNSTTPPQSKPACILTVTQCVQVFHDTPQPIVNRLWWRCYRVTWIALLGERSKLWPVTRIWLRNTGPAEKREINWSQKYSKSGCSGKSLRGFVQNSLLWPAPCYVLSSEWYYRSNYMPYTDENFLLMFTKFLSIRRWN
jgi:hypothetical protein